MKYFLDFSQTDLDAFALKDCEEHDTICEGKLSEVPGADVDWQDALDRYFEARYGISPAEWEVG